MLPHFVEDTSTLDNLLNEIINSTSERCLDPVAMEQTIVAQIAMQKKAKLNTSY
jgi:hypothetical protein